MTKTKNNFSQRLYLISLLVKRTIKNQYYRSFIGILWTVLNPLLNMIVMAFIFTQLFGRDTDGLVYPIYLLSGNIIFTLMSGSTSTSLGCLVGHTSMLQKTKVPIEIFPTSTVFSSLVTFGFSFIALLLVAAFYAITGISGGYVFTWEIVLVIAILPALIIFSLGISYFLSALFVFFRDLKHIYSVITTLWRFLTPIFYTLSTLKNDTITKIMIFNPMYHYVQGFRELLMGNIPALFSLTDPSWVAMYGFAAISLLIGWSVLRALRNRIAANL